MNNKRSGGELLRRYVSFAVALFIIAFGTCLSIRANLGSSPISAPPYVLSLVPGAPLTMGQFTICMHIFFILSQIVLLRKDFQKIQLLQIVVSFVFGAYTDICMWLTGYLQIFSDTPIGYTLRFVELLIGGAILAYGISMEVHCDVLMLAGEGFPLAISKVVKKDFGKVKMCSDTGLVCVGVIFMFVFFGHWDWRMVGFGTLVSMFYVGAVVRVLSPHFGWLEAIFAIGGKEVQALAAEAATATAVHGPIITISREVGAGGHAIGKIIADRLGIPLYDKDIIDATAEKLGYSPDFVAKNEQNIPTSKLWELIFTDKSIPQSMNPSKDDAIFISESRTINQLAAAGPCVIIGRCANWLLRKNPNVVSVFVRCDAGSGENEAVNRARANHYWHYTGKVWTDSGQYDLVVNTTKLGIERSADYILQLVRRSPTARITGQRL